MDTTKSSPRPYLAIFALVALVAAAFILKQEFAGAGQAGTSGSADSKTAPDRLLVETKAGRVPEPIPDWFKRVGYQKLGFATEQDMKITKDMLTAHRGAEKTPEQLKELHALLASQGIPKQLGVSLLPGLQQNARKEFLPDVRALYVDGAPNQNFTTIVKRWYTSGDPDLIKSLQKDPDPQLAAYMKQLITDLEYPGKDM